MDQRRGILAVISLALIFTLPNCGKKAKGPAQAELTNEQKIMEKFETFKKGYQNRDVNTILSVVSNNYHDGYNQSKEAFRSWLQNSLAGWEWTDSLKIDISGEIDVTLGWLDMELQVFHPTTARANVEASIRAKKATEDVLVSSVFDLRSTWTLEELTTQWMITRLSGTTAHLGTSPISVAAGSTVNVVAYTLPYGAPLEDYDTRSVTVLDWNNYSIPLADQGNKKYVGTFTAPASPGQYELQATLSDTTQNKIISLSHLFTVR